MSGTVADRKRLLHVTAGNLRNNHIYITGQHDFFPMDSIAPRAKNGRQTALGIPIRIQLDGLNVTVETDIARDSKTGNPRRTFRRRGWVRAFFGFHSVREGDTLALDRLSPRDYRLSVAERTVGVSPPVRFAEFFAGIGLVRLALMRHGLHPVFANDIDADKYTMYTENFGDSEFVLGSV